MKSALVVEHKTSSEEIGPGSSYWSRLILDSQVSNYLVGARALGFAPRGVLYDVAKRPALRPSLATPPEDRKYTLPKDKACPACKKKGGPETAPHDVVLETEADGTELVARCKDGRIVTDPGGRLYSGMRDRDETPDEYRLRLREDIAANPEKYFQRGMVVRLDEEEYAAAEDTWTLAKWIREIQVEQGAVVSAKRPRPAYTVWPRNVDACMVYGSVCDYWAVCSGQASLDDPTRYRRAVAHEELSTDGKRRLPLVTTSSLKTFRSCARKYFFRYELGVRPVVASDALRFGTLFHIGLETWWKTVDVGAAWSAMRIEYGKHEIAQIDAVRAEELLLGYHVRWKDEPLTVAAVEAEFDAPLVNPRTGAESKTFRLGGKIDAIVEAPEAAVVGGRDAA